MEGLDFRVTKTLLMLQAFVSAACNEKATGIGTEPWILSCAHMKQRYYRVFTGTQDTFQY